MTKAEKGYQSPGAELNLISHQFPFEFYRFLRSNPSLTFVVYQEVFFLPVQSIVLNLSRLLRLQRISRLKKLRRQLLGQA